MSRECCGDDRPTTATQSMRAVVARSQLTATPPAAMRNTRNLCPGGVTASCCCRWPPACSG